MKVQYILGFIVFIILSILYFNYNPEMYSFFPECPFHKFLHLDCPGCGAQRAIHSLLHGNIMKAANHNLLLVLSLPILIIHFVLYIVSLTTGKDHRLKIWQNPLVPKIILFIVICFWIFRNIPFAPFKYLAA